MAQLDAVKTTLATKQATAESASADLAAKQAAFDQAKTGLDAAQAKADAAGAAHSGKSVAKDSAQIAYVDLNNRHLAEGHDWGAWVITKEATVASAGVQERACSCCGEKDAQAIAPIAPAVVFSNATEPSEWYYESVYRAADRNKFNSMPDSGSTDWWAADSVAWGLNNGVISGRSDTYIAPLDSVTRAEMAAVLMNAIDGGLLG